MNDHVVKVGQVWADNDKRAEGRTVRVDRISRVHYSFTGMDVDGEGVLVAGCTVLTGRGGKPVKSRRQVTIRVSRMRPTANGFRLVSELQKEG